ncbi:MAG: hypothetical protein OXN17_08150 [Candidatus Poribacteria bacterium]|nr:hypothetical protein [Candidatus Poribacteria bacterium]MDE0503279.1 hypothetical protein [Candidatus Poribacteria bacterium]
MMIQLRKRRTCAIIAIVVLGAAVGAFLHWRTRQPPPPTTVYVMPEPNPDRAKILDDMTRASKHTFRRPKPEQNATPPSNGEAHTQSDILSLTDAQTLEEDEHFEMFPERETEKPAAVSPFGFGPYPEVPADYPEDVIWQNDLGLDGGNSKMAELMDRVLIKLWKRGHRVTSVSGDAYRMYPAYPNTAYVEWAYHEDENGVRHRYAGRVTGGPGVTRSHVIQLHDGIVPDGISILDHRADAIDPYEFLDLQR